MAGVASFEAHALARLRARLGEAEEARADLIAFARGHSGAVAAIHQAVLAAIGAADIPELLAIVTGDWPAMLAIDSLAVALIVGDEGFRADREGVQRLDPQLLRRALDAMGQVTMRGVERGHPFFGAAAPSIRAEAMIALDCGPGLPCGLLLLGQARPVPLDNSHGAQLLRFLGDSLGAMIAGWLTTPTD